MNPFHPTRIVKHASMDLDMGANVEVEYHPGSWMHTWHAGKDFHVTEGGFNPTHPESHWQSNPSHPSRKWHSASGKGAGLMRVSSDEAAADGSEYGSVAFSALEAAALRSALSAQRQEKVVVSDKPGGGLEPAGITERARLTKLSGYCVKEGVVKNFEEQQRIKYPRKNGFGADPLHTIALKSAGPSTKPGTVPWVRPSAKPENWTCTQSDQEFIKNGPARPLLPETDMHNQSLPYFASVDPICETIRDARPMPQDYRLYRLFEKMQSSPSPLTAMSMSSSQVASRPYTGATRSSRTPGSPGGVAVFRDQRSQMRQGRLGNPAAFKIKEFDSVWGVDNELLVGDKTNISGAQTHREGLQRSGRRPSPIRVATAGVDARAGSRSPSSRLCNALGLTPRSPIIRGLVIAKPRAIARNRNDIPLVASVPGSRAPVSHGTFVPDGPRTVKTGLDMFSTTHLHGRGTKYTTSDKHHITTSSCADQESAGSQDGFAELPFVNLHTFDEHFSSPQRLTPLSRRSVEHAGFEAGNAEVDGDLSRTPRSPLRSPPREAGSSRSPLSPQSGATILRVASGGNQYFEEDTSGKTEAYEHEGARAELLQQFRHDRQRRKWQIRGLSREKQLNAPGSLHGQKVLVEHNQQAEEFEWDDEEKRWIRSFPPGPPVKSKQFEAKKETIPVRANQSPTLKMPTTAYGARYICPDNGQSMVQEDGIARYGLLLMQDRFMQSLRSE